MRLSVVVVVVGCGRIDFDPHVDNAGCTLGPWGTPTRIAELATANDDWGGQITPDGLALYFNTERTIYVARRPDRASMFGTPTTLPELGGGDQGNPSTTGDELELYFDSNRAGDYSVWTAQRSSPACAFGPPTQLAVLDVGASATAPFVSPDGLRLYYMLGLPEGTLMWTSRASRTDAFVAGTPITGIVGTMHGTPALSADQLSIYYDSGVNPTRDLSTASRATIADPFAAATQLSVDTADDEADASITADGLELHFASNRPGGPGGSDLYVAKRACM